MKDKKFLTWIHGRLVNVHKESPHYDYMHKLRAIIKAMPAHQETPNVASSPDELEEPKDKE